MDDRERFKAITKYGVIPAPSGPGAVVIHADEGRDCHVVLGVFRPSDKARKIAITTLARCTQSVFGYPNDEAYWHDPRGGDGDRPGYGFYEVLCSSWPRRLAAYNRHAFPDSTAAHYAGYRHFIIGCHDASGEFLAEDLTVEITDDDYEAALEEALRRTWERPPDS